MSGGCARWVSRRGARAVLLGIVFAACACSQFRFERPPAIAPGSALSPPDPRTLGILKPRDERGPERSAAIPLGALLPVPYVGLTVTRPERFFTMSTNEYKGTRATLRDQLQDIVARSLGEARVFGSVVSVASSGDFRRSGQDLYLRLIVRSTTARGATPTYFVTYTGALPLYLAGLPFWTGRQELFIDAELLDGRSLGTLWRKSYEKTSKRSWRGFAYGRDPARAANRLLEDLVQELAADLGAWTREHAREAPRESEGAASGERYSEGFMRMVDR